MFRLTLIMSLAACIFTAVECLAQEVNNEEDWSAVPVSVTPGNAATAPSDAKVLFDGKDLGQWTHSDGAPASWKVLEGMLEIVPGSGDIYTKTGFGDVQLHVEWMIPETNFGNGNSGIYLQGRYEVQIYNSFDNESEIYYNGQTGSLYKQHKPLANASKPKGEWNTFDILFTAPRFSTEGRLVSPAGFTVLHNGILIQDRAKLKGVTTHEKRTRYEPHELKEPLMIQDHGDRVLFRNIWIREL